MLRMGIVCALLMTAAAAGGAEAFAAELQIVNSSGKAISELYLAVAGARTWGPDLLRDKQSRTIARGETHTVAEIMPGNYQLMLVDADGSECEIEFVEITTTYRIDLTSRRLQECTSSH